MNEAAANSDAEIVREVARVRGEIVNEIGKVIVGQEKVVDLLLISLMSSGHSLFVGVPGLAKTLLVSTLSDVLNLRFNRVQFTPDLMPSDITGSEVLERDQLSDKRFFRFIHGPITNIMTASGSRTIISLALASLRPLFSGFSSGPSITF